MLIYRVAPTASLFDLIPAGLLMFAHSVWMLVMLGILGARYRDLSEVVEMVMRIAFLATTKINRQDFGLSWNRLVEGTPMLGDEVDVEIAVEAE